MTIIEEAKRKTWGPTINKPKSPKEAVDYAISVFGDCDLLCSLGEVYAIKGLLWLSELYSQVNEATESDKLDKILAEDWPVFKE